jgi:hypothetical protein
MLLSEAIKEKVYIEESIRNLKNHIIVMDVEGNPDIANRYMKELDELYKRYQQFAVSIERTKGASFIKLNDTKVSLTDAFVIKESMEYKLKAYEYIFSGVLRKEGDGQGHVDLDWLFEETEKIRLDIKTIGAEIDFAVWNVETS